MGSGRHTYCLIAWGPRNPLHDQRRGHQRQRRGQPLLWCVPGPATRNSPAVSACWKARHPSVAAWAASSITGTAAERYARWLRELLRGRLSRRWRVLGDRCRTTVPCRAEASAVGQDCWPAAGPLRPGWRLRRRRSGRRSKAMTRVRSPRPSIPRSAATVQLTMRSHRSRSGSPSVRLPRHGPAVPPPGPDHRKGTRPVTPWVRSEPRPLTPTS